MAREANAFIAWAGSIDEAIEPLRHLADKIGAPVLHLTIRLFMAHIFFVSGWSKLRNALNGDWASTVFLFEMEHPVPGLAPDVAAILGTGGEIILPVLLGLGLFARFGAAGLLFMTGVIEFTYMNNIEHWMWALLLGVIFVRGPGKLSVDYLIRRALQSGT